MSDEVAPEMINKSSDSRSHLNERYLPEGICDAIDRAVELRKRNGPYWRFFPTRMLYYLQEKEVAEDGK